MQLHETLGKSIATFCENGFDDASQNHCAHFVSHVLDIDVGYDCKVHENGKKRGASIRVHELFAACPQVGHFNDAPDDLCLVFVTRRQHVDIGRHSMINHPQKHVGIYDGEAVYHYSNTQDVVVRQSPADFLARFERVYDGDQALYFGTLPTEARAAPIAAPVVEPDRPSLTARKETIGGKDHWFARLDGGAEFPVGRAARYEGLVGLKRSIGDNRYVPADHAQRIGAEVATLLGIVAAGESDRRYDCINSYDRAAFTFGFFQLAAHTPDDNLILLFRKLAADHAGFRKQFPELGLKDGRLCRKLPDGALFNLERPHPRPDNQDELNLKDFMAWCNPDPDAVDDTEVDRAARLVWLANHDDAFNALQVDVARHITMTKLRERYATKLGLDGVNGLVCAAVCDIHHQGRARFDQVRPIVHSRMRLKDKLHALTKFGEAKYGDRSATLRRALEEAKDSALARSVFDRASGVFRPATGWID